MSSASSSRFLVAPGLRGPSRRRSFTDVLAAKQLELLRELDHVSDLVLMERTTGRAWRKIGRPIEDGLNTVAVCKSADVRDPFLGLRLGCGSGLCRKLEHCCFLTFEHVSEEHDLSVWKFQRIVMCSRVVLVDLPEDGSRVINCSRFPAEQTTRPTTYLPGKGEFRSRKNTNCCVGILRRSEPSSASIEVAG